MAGAGISTSAGIPDFQCPDEDSGVKDNKEKADDQALEDEIDKMHIEIFESAGSKQGDTEPVIVTKDDLCEACAKIDIDARFSVNAEFASHSMSPPSADSATYGFRILTDLSASSGSCKLCRIRTWCPETYVAHVIAGSKYELHATRNRVKSFHCNFAEDWPMFGNCGPVTALRLWSNLPGYTMGRPVQVDFLSIPKSVGSVRLLRSDSVDFAALRSWLEFCQEHHTKSCGTSTSYKPNIKLIDCETRKLVDSEDLPYLTLSYLWGQDSAPVQFSEELPDPSMLHNTIKDSITVTLKLGFRYLWIDRYCINQSDPQAALEQIQQMDSIYKNSEITIVALAGEGPSYGLPGIGNCHRRRQFRFHIGQHCFVGPYRRNNDIMTNSRWASRGWTYQEGLLSTRRLFFTDEQVYCECERTYCYEAIDIPRYGEAPRYADRSLIGGIFEHIGEYSMRSFTKSSDRLNGFLGMLHSREVTENLRHHWGTPICPHRDPPASFGKKKKKEKSSIQYPVSEFVMALSFYYPSHSPITRIPSLPSWSWAGWNGHIYYEPFMYRGIYTPLEVKVFFELKSGELIDWNHFHDRYAELNKTAQLSHFIHITAQIVLAHVDKEIMSDGNIQCSFRFRFDDGYHICTVPVVATSTANVYYGIIWGTRHDRVLVILAAAIEGRVERIGICSLYDSGEILTPNHQRIQDKIWLKNHYGEEWWTHLETECSTLRLG